MLEIIAQILFGSADKPVKIMKNKLNGAIRAGNKRPQTTTGKTANSISANRPQNIGGILNWEFKSNDTAVRLNNGGSLKTWARKKYALDEESAKRMAFAVAASAVKNGRTVKAYGWLDNAKAQIDQQINKDMAAAITIAINQKINKALK